MLLLDSGYESLSGFADAISAAFGTPPSRLSADAVVTVNRLISPLGPLLTAATEDGIVALEFWDPDSPEQLHSVLSRQTRRTPVPGTTPDLDQLDRQLHEYFSGSRCGFDLRLAPAGTEFQQQAWQALREIPYAQTRSYGQQAATIGRPTAVRAVARANQQNPISIIVPCHRVIGADGTLTGYGGGLWRKRYLLELERSALAGRTNTG